MGLRIIAFFSVWFCWAQAQAITVSGDIEGQGVFLEARTFLGLENQCFSYLEKEGIPSFVDDIHISVNGLDKQHLRNGPSYWNTASEICDQILSYTRSIAKEERGGKKGRGDSLSVKGFIEDVTFFFEARRLRGLQVQCLEFHETEDITERVDDIYISVNGGEESHLRNGPSYWRTGKEVCEQIVTHLREKGFGQGSRDPEPIRCGDYALGEIWKEVDHNNPIIRHKSCQEGRTGQVIVTRERIVEKTCTRHGVVDTGQEEVGEVLSRERQCQRVRLSCTHPAQGVVAHGETIYQKAPGEVIREAVSCPFGGKEFDIFQRRVPVICNDGVIEAADGQARKGRFLRKSKKRCEAPKSCGSHTHGSRWSETLANPVRRRENCGAGGRGKQVVVYDQKVIKTCYNGQIRENRPELVLKKRRQCQMTCGKAYGHNGGISQQAPRSRGRDANDIPFVELPENSKPGHVVTVKCNRFVSRPVQDSATFRCNNQGQWVTGWDNSPRGRDDFRPRACQQEDRGR